MGKTLLPKTDSTLLISVSPFLATSCQFAHPTTTARCISSVPPFHDKQPRLPAPWPLARAVAPIVGAAAAAPADPARRPAAASAAPAVAAPAAAPPPLLRTPEGRPTVTAGRAQRCGVRTRAHPTEAAAPAAPAVTAPTKAASAVAAAAAAVTAAPTEAAAAATTAAATPAVAAAAAKAAARRQCLQGGRDDLLCLAHHLHVEQTGPFQPAFLRKPAHVTARSRRSYTATYCNAPDDNEHACMLPAASSNTAQPGVRALGDAPTLTPRLPWSHISTYSQRALRTCGKHSPTKVTVRP